MSDKQLYGISDKEIEEMEEATEGLRLRALDKHNSDVEVMTLLKVSCNQYLKRFGKESNLYHLLRDVSLQLDKNIDETKKFMDFI